MTLQTFGKGQVGKKFHVSWPTLKHVENSIRGIRYAARHGYHTIDLDMQPDEDAFLHGLLPGHIWNTHWGDPFRRDGFRDPKHILGKGDLMREMSPVEIRRLVAGYWPRRYRIPTIEESLRACRRYGIQALIEPKACDRVFKNQATWNYLASVAAQAGTKTAVYSEHHEYLPYARNAGFRAWPI